MAFSPNNPGRQLFRLRQPTLGKEAAVWNAASIRGINIDQESPTPDEILQYDGRVWTYIEASSLIPSSIELEDGSEEEPSLHFINDTDTGLYLRGENELGFTAGGEERMRIQPSEVSFSTAINMISSSQIKANIGTETEPGYTFNNDEDTGMYRVGPNQLAFTTEGTRKMLLGSSASVFGIPIRGVFGTEQAPSYTFDSNSNMGMYRAGLNQIGFSTLGTERMLIETSTISVSNQLQVEIGSESAPGYSFIGDPDTGMYSDVPNNVYLAAGGTLALRTSSTTMQLFPTVIANNGIRLSPGTASAPSYTFNIDSDTGMYRSDADELSFSLGGSQVATMAIGVFGYAGDVIPKTDNLYSLGTSDNRWSEVFAANGTIQTSDCTMKRNIRHSDLGLDFVNALRPVAYQWKQDDDKTQTDDKTHYGFIAQDVKELVTSSDIDFGGLHDTSELYGLRYCEFIAILTRAVQELTQEMETMKQKCSCMQ